MAGDETGKPKTELEKCVNRLYRIFSSSVGLLLLLIGYSFLGAAIFHAIEGPLEKATRENLTDARQKFLRIMWNESTRSSNMQAWSQRASKALEEYEDVYGDALSKSVDADDVHEWDFWGSLFYAGTVYTTIGYGHISPVTTEGRVATMIYAIVGIPLCLIVLADLGKLFTRAIKFLWSFVRRCYYTGKCTKKRKTSPPPGQTDDAAAADDCSEIYEVDDEFNLPVPVAILITVAYICAGAGMYRLWEKSWGYLDAFYFIFISISTIGFGDIVPDHPRYFIISSLYVFIGLALVSMCINVIMDVLSNTISKAGERFTKSIQRTVHIRLEAFEDEEEKLEEKKAAQ